MALLMIEMVVADAAVSAYSEKEADVAAMMVALRPLASRPRPRRRWRHGGGRDDSCPALGFKVLQHAQGNDDWNDDG